LKRKKTGGERKENRLRWKEGSKKIENSSSVGFYSMLSAKSFPTFRKTIDTFIFIDKKFEKRLLGLLNPGDVGNAVFETIGQNISSETTKSRRIEFSAMPLRDRAINMNQ
jgi:hypothetical protein